MTDDMIELGKRAVACPKWRWTPGMLASLDGIDGDYRARVCRVENGRFWSDATPLPYDLTSYVPDLSDPATLGCLLALVREAWGNPHIVVERGWDLAWGHERPGPSGYWLTEAEMLVAALESAP